MKNLILKMFIFLYFFSSCVFEEDVDLTTNYQRKPVIFSVISPQNDIIRVYVSRTFAFGEEVTDSSLRIQNSTIILSSDEKSVNVPFDSTYNTYAIKNIDFPIKRGEKYYLEVTLPTGEKATAETVVPSSDVVIDSITLKRIGPYFFSETNNSYVFDFFFRIYARIINSDKNAINYACIYSSNISTVKNESFFLNVFDMIIGPNMNFENDTLIKNIFVLDKSLKEYFDYSNTTESYLSPENEYEVFKGVYPEYTNIKGGYGIFGSYLKSDPFKLYSLVD